MPILRVWEPEPDPTGVQRVIRGRRRSPSRRRQIGLSRQGDRSCQTCDIASVRSWVMTPDRLDDRPAARRRTGLLQVESQHCSRWMVAPAGANAFTLGGVVGSLGGCRRSQSARRHRQPWRRSPARRDHRVVRRLNTKSDRVVVVTPAFRVCPQARSGARVLRGSASRPDRRRR